MLLSIENTGLLVFWVVAAARILIPLTIPLYPLPGITASLVLDAVDQTIFQQYPGLNLQGYQGYDKALDIYYLTIAYISTLRNWKNHFAFRVSRFLFYWRLAGVVLFELTHLRWLLLVFPNTFEYFFIFYEVYRLRWDPMRMSKKYLVSAAALIWIVIKLPQEYWIHIFQGDLTDSIKTALFNVPANTSWSVILRTQPVMCLSGFIVIGLALAGLFWFLKRSLPPPERKLAFAHYEYQPSFAIEKSPGSVASVTRRMFKVSLLEKISLVALVSLSFAQVLPGVRATDLQLVLGVSVIVVLNTALSQFLSQRGFGIKYALWQYFVLASANAIVMFIYAVLRTALDYPILIANAVFFVLLFSLLITLFDQYRIIYMRRFYPSEQSHQTQPTLEQDESDEQGR